ncbi:hypothetical protein VBM89_01585 [Mycoplasma sp. 1199]|uniref:hypothetical protein n=1 Tax=Mycoplasma sp. 1199 TaxID=3108526 RepID=UPI002B1D7ABE|nr:hypothetical protein [Mycoplasma sp. 1199]MEA4206202.1 hypothetical protein [Mycoplasma sp. 1199]
MIEPMNESNSKRGGIHTPIVYNTIVALFHSEILTASTMHITNNENAIAAAGNRVKVTLAFIMIIGNWPPELLVSLNRTAAKVDINPYAIKNTIVKMDKTNIGIDKKFFCILK